MPFLDLHGIGVGKYKVGAEITSARLRFLQVEKTGEIVWSVPSQVNAILECDHLDNLFEFENYHLRKRDADGGLIWEVPEMVGSIGVTLHYSKSLNVLLFHRANGTSVECRDVHDGTLIWSYPIGGGTTNIKSNADYILITRNVSSTSDNSVVVLNSDGSLHSQFRHSNFNNHYDSLISKDGYIYVMYNGTSSRMHIAKYTPEGSRVWDIDHGTGVYVSITENKAGELNVINVGGAVHKYDTNGVLIKSYSIINNTSGSIYSIDVINVQKNGIVYGIHNSSSRYMLYKFNLESTAMTIYKDLNILNRTIAVSYDGYLYAINRINGDIQKIDMNEYYQIMY